MAHEGNYYVDCERRYSQYSPMAKDALGFALLVILVLLVFTGVWATLKVYGESRKLPHFQTDTTRSIENIGQVQTSRSSSHQVWKRYPFVIGRFEQGSWVTEHAGGVVSLADFLSATLAPLIFLELQIIDTADLAQLKTLIDNNHSWRRIVFINRADGINQELRELAPHWTLTSGEVFLARLLMFHSLGLARLLDIPHDILYLTKQAELDQSTLDELCQLAHEQNKLVIFEQQVPPLSVDNVDILILH